MMSNLLLGSMLGVSKIKGQNNVTTPINIFRDVRSPSLFNTRNRVTVGGAELIRSEFDAGQLRYVVEGAPDADQDVEDLVKLLVLDADILASLLGLGGFFLSPLILNK